MQAMSDLQARYDAVVVGGRCAGAATALLLARSGLSVLVVEQGAYGSDTLSTHALMRGGVLQLRRWGLLERLRAAGTPPVRTTTFHYAGERVEIAIEPRDGVDALYAPRRTRLDALLVDAARESGAQVVFGTRLVGVSRNREGRVCGVTVERRASDRRQIGAGIVIGADGVQSTVARSVGAEIYREGAAASGVVYGYWSGLESEGFHWLYRSGVSAGVIPTDDGMHCVFVSVPSRRFLDEIRHDLPGGLRRVMRETDTELARRVAAATGVERLRGFAGLRGYLRRSQGAGWALVGDAGCFKDPLTAHGITDALRDAELLARAVASGDEARLADYPKARDAFAEGFLALSDEIARLDSNLDALREAHVALSRAMGREVRALVALDDEPQEHTLLERSA